MDFTSAHESFAKDSYNYYRSEFFRLLNLGSIDE